MRITRISAAMGQSESELEEGEIDARSAPASAVTRPSACCARATRQSVPTPHQRSGEPNRPLPEALRTTRQRHQPDVDPGAPTATCVSHCTSYRSNVRRAVLAMRRPRPVRDRVTGFRQAQDAGWSFGIGPEESSPGAQPPPRRVAL